MKSNAATPVWTVFLGVEVADLRLPRPPRPRIARPRKAGLLPVAAEDLVRPPPLFPRTIAGIGGFVENGCEAEMRTVRGVTALL